jgi:galactokinase/galacturonokinase
LNYRSAAADFEERFGRSAEAVRVARVPYRVCPLGAHTDHQRGLVIGFTLEPALRVFFRARTDRVVRARSREFPGEALFERGAAAMGDAGFGGYLRGIAARLGDGRGADLWIEGDLKPGGVGSSAALQIGCALALLDVDGRRLDRADLMRLVVSSEQAGAGVNVGLLDPAVILFGEKDHLVFLDCDEGTPRVQHLAASLPPFDFLLVDSGDDRALRASPYNDRVAECRAAAAALGAKGDPPVLREVTLEDLRRKRKGLEPVLARRAEHVLNENKRVKTGLAALQQGDLRAFGQLVSASGQSMVRLFDAGTPVTIPLLEALQRDPDVIGATLSGAGFGGSLAAIVARDGATRVSARLRAAAPRASFRVTGTGDGPAVAASL